MASLCAKFQLGRALGSTTQMDHIFYIAFRAHNDIAEIIEYHDKEKGLVRRKLKVWGLDGLYSRSGKRLGYAAGPGFGRGNSLRAEGIRNALEIMQF